MSLPDEKSVEAQKVYEKWVKKPYWSASETACLFNGTEPGADSEDNNIQTLITKIHDAVSTGGLDSVESSAGDAAFAGVTPVSAYRWARANGIELPAELGSLMEFVSKSLMPVDAGAMGSPPVETQKQTGDAERVLGACVAVLANYPGECLNKRGKVKTERVLKLLGSHSGRLFGDEIPALSSTAIRDLLNNWVNKLKN